MTLLRHYRIAVLFILLAFAATALLYGQLPDHMPMRWTLGGQVDGYLPKRWGAWIVPSVAALAVAAMAHLLAVKRSSTIIITAVAGLMLFSCGVTWYAAIHPADTPLAYLFIGLGVFLVAVGNILGKLTWSYFVGIRTPWTIDDPRVWERTHRVAGPVFVVGGIAMFGAGIAHASAPVLLALLLATCLYPVIYSYYAWRQG
jgi:uncharacterized membrane protein